VQDLEIFSPKNNLKSKTNISKTNKIISLFSFLYQELLQNRPRFLSFSPGSVHNVVLISKESEFNLLDDVLWDFVFKKSLAQVIPIHLKVLFFDRHVLVERVHIRPLIIIRATEFSDQVKGHSVVELRDVAHILQPKCIKSVVGQSMLVKLGHYQTQLLLTSHLINEPLL